MAEVSGVHPFIFHHSHAAQGRDAIASLAHQRESPPAGSKLSALLVTQRDEREDAVYNHRPHTLTGPLVQIYNPAFVTFIREMSHPCTTVEFSDVELDNALDFIDASLSFYEHRFDRRTKIHELKALGCLGFSEIFHEPRVIRHDGTTTVICPTSGQEAVVRIVEMKNEIGEGGSDPIAQAECGFVLICSSQKVTRFLIAPAYTQPPPFRSTSHSKMLHVVRCSSSGSPVHISPSLVPSSRKGFFRNGSRTTSTSDHSLPPTEDPP